jgi:hypothetical protein
MVRDPGSRPIPRVAVPDHDGPGAFHQHLLVPLRRLGAGRYASSIATGRRTAARYCGSSASEPNGRMARRGRASSWACAGGVARSRLELIPRTAERILSLSPPPAPE